MERETERSELKNGIVNSEEEEEEEESEETAINNIVYTNGSRRWSQSEVRLLLKRS